jgi:hypothetical protein
MGFLKAIFGGESNGKPTEMLTARFRCPCCGFPTLTESAAFEICGLCNWEDDGQSGQDADDVLGGPKTYRPRRTRAMEPGIDVLITLGNLTAHQAVCKVWGSLGKRW